MTMDDRRNDDEYEYIAGPSHYDNGSSSGYGTPPRAGGSGSGSNQLYRNYDQAPYGTNHNNYEEPFDVNEIDPALRLRTTRTAHSVITESIRGEEVRQRKRDKLLEGLRRRTTRRKGRSDKKDKATLTAEGLATIQDADVDEQGKMPSLHPEREGSGSSADEPKKGKKVLPRRTIYVNTPLPPQELDAHGEPRVRYARNKVRTSKYTLVTFLPRNLFEQFHRVANIYFLGLVILQLFPMFGATTPQIAMLPLVAILGMTAIKDAIEDWRRARLDEEVNTSAATKLGGWKNVNQPIDPRHWLQRLLHLGPGKLIDVFSS
jgi:phospholipid-translocating ATPase